MSAWPEVDPELLEPLSALKGQSAELDDASNWPSQSLAVLGEAGVLGWVIPREYGGGEFSGAGLVEGYLQLARECLVSTFVLTQRNAACQRIAMSDNEALKAKLLPQTLGEALDELLPAGSLIALELSGMTLNIFSKIGIVMLVGLVTKNSILIVEFANQLRERGQGIEDAILGACRRRFRPILMTSVATIVGILPIALGFGSGGESRAPLGVAVVGGMLFSTLLTFFVVPVSYVVLEKSRKTLGGLFRGEATAADESLVEAP